MKQLKSRRSRRVAEKSLKATWLLSFFSCLAAFSASAALRLASPFADNMVLQCDRPLPVWGTAAPGVRISVEFAGQSVSTISDATGKWRLTLAPTSASCEGRELTVNDGEVVLRNVLVGEVWLASGQSNMAFRFCNANPRTKERNGALLAQITARPTVRYATVGGAAADTPQQWVDIRWHAFEPKFLLHGHPSAVATYFALELESALRVPVGIVGCPVGGTCIDAWIDHDAESAKSAHPPRRPSCRAGVLYNGKIAPLAPFAFKGILWYQGEADSDEPEKYAGRMARLRDGWGRAFGNPNCPFLFVQLAPFDYNNREVRHDLVALQLAQSAFAESSSNAYMTVANDLGNLSDIHPNDKRPVGLRLAALALRHVYAFTNVEADAPCAVRALPREGGRVEVVFRHGKGLYVYNEDKSLSIGIELAGEDGVFHPANIVDIEKNGLLKGPLTLFSDGVQSPTRVRYLFNRPWYGALRNASGLPAGPFELVVEK